MRVACFETKPDEAVESDSIRPSLNAPSWFANRNKHLRKACSGGVFGSYIALT